MVYVNYCKGESGNPPNKIHYQQLPLTTIRLTSLRNSCQQQPHGHTPSSERKKITNEFFSPSLVRSRKNEMRQR